MIHGLPVTVRVLRVKFDKFTDKSDWLRIRNDYSAHAQKIVSFQKSRFMVLTKRSAASRMITSTHELSEYVYVSMT